MSDRHADRADAASAGARVDERARSSPDQPVVGGCGSCTALTGDLCASCVSAVGELFPVGSRLIVLGDLPDEPDVSVGQGAVGTVTLIDDAGTVHCQFEGGARLGVLPTVDPFARLAR